MLAMAEFVGVLLLCGTQEPPKLVQVQYEAGLLPKAPARQALCVIELPTIHAVAEALISLDAPGSVTHWRQVRTSAQPQVVMLRLVELLPFK